ncbi:hypothetical protein FS827_22305 [Agrobacterium vitis]|uniref:hypothetical protein n=1 Tax=Allorhizobium ampelinum TaxID=3025782 RepID=UPI001F310FCF|nr:hypothetical protein [Allorhizobium ampelinum]MCF1464040.1 hypothetical protein [Allorhizobium ampelinum]
MSESDFNDIPDNDPDLLENTGLPKTVISRLRNAFFTRLSDFDEMTDIEMLREPGINWRTIKAVRSERATVKTSGHSEKDSSLKAIHTTADRDHSRLDLP